MPWQSFCHLIRHIVICGQRVVEFTPEIAKLPTSYSALCTIHVHITLFVTLSNLNFWAPLSFQRCFWLTCQSFDWFCKKWTQNRVSVQGVKSLGGHFACLCQGFEFYEVKKFFFCYYFSKRKWKYFYTFYHFHSEKSSKRAK